MREIILKQLQKVKNHYTALKNYKELIDKMEFDFSEEMFSNLSIQQQAILEAYLKRFSSLQDYLGAKVFKSLLDIAGISYTKMSEVLSLVENEDIIDLDKWIEFRSIRNELEHDYPDDLETALRDLKFCLDNFYEIERIVNKVFDFARRYGANI